MLNNLQRWQQLQSTWSEAMAAAKSAETQLDRQIRHIFEHEQPAATTAPDAGLSMNEVMQCWLLASQSLAAMDEFVSEQLSGQTASKHAVNT